MVFAPQSSTEQSIVLLHVYVHVRVCVSVCVCPKELAAMQSYETDVCVGHYCNRSIYFIYPGRDGWSAPSGHIAHTWQSPAMVGFHGKSASNRREALK